MSVIVDDHRAFQHSATMSAAPLRPSKRRVLNGLKMLQFQSPCALRSMIDFLLSARKLVVKPRDIRADPKSPAVASGAPSCLAPNKSQFNRCSVAPLPGTTPFFAGPAQRGVVEQVIGQPLRRAGCGCRAGNGASQTVLSSFWPESSSAHTPKSQC